MNGAYRPIPVFNPFTADCGFDDAVEAVRIIQITSIYNGFIPSRRLLGEDEDPAR